MIEIKKNREPAELTAHRKTEYAAYENMPSETRRSVLDSLMREQGYICAYCMRRIPQKGKNPAVTIEHLDAQSKTGADKALDYRNMIAVCNGNRGNEERFMTCDARRGNKPVTVNPLSASTLTSIRYKSDGTILADDPQIDYDLNETLNLNCNSFGLVDSRRDALQSMLRVLKGKRPTGDIKLYCSRQLEKLKSAPTKEPYVGILIWWLENHS